MWIDILAPKNIHCIFRSCRETRSHFESHPKTVNIQGYSELQEPIRTRESCYPLIWWILKMNICLVSANDVMQRYVMKHFLLSRQHRHRDSDKILQLHCKRNRWREGTPTVDASKSEGKIRQRLKFTVKIVFFDAAIGSNSYTICTVHVKNIFPTDSEQPISKQNPCWTKFSFTIFITFISPKPCQVRYVYHLCIAALSFKSSISKIY